jgi:hypothetical protein
MARPDKAEKHSEHYREKIADKYLRDLLDKACLSVDIQLDEWDMNRTLYKSLIEAPKIKSKKSLMLFSNFDNCYNLLKELNIRVNVKYKWFTDIQNHI